MRKNPLRSRRVLLGTAVVAVPVAALGVLLGTGTSEAAEFIAAADVRSADGASLGTVLFTTWSDKTVVSAHLRMPATPDSFHGFHVHANDKPENGVGCVADPTKAPDTWFVSADGHLADVGQAHGMHHGDMPSLLVNQDGTVDITFTTGRMKLADLDNRVVMVHAKPDNFNNVPTGTATDQYAPNSPAATDKSAATGNAGDRIGCGVIQPIS
jgi:superoxide dismutase, Cu-Zn family